MNTNKDLTEMNFSEFCEYIDGEGCDTVEQVLYYENMFEIYREKETGRYFYLESAEDDASDFFEVSLAAQLLYDDDHDLLVKDGAELSKMFDCVVCGERACDNHIEYLWFAKKDNLP